MANKNRKRGVMRLHRTLGMTAAIFVIVLAATGLALNHTKQLMLDSRHLSATAARALYGVEAPPMRTTLVGKQQWISQIDRTLYLNEHVIATANAPLIGAIDVDGILAVATSRAVFLVTPQGQLIDTLGSESGTPLPIEALGKDPHNRLLLQHARGLFRSDRDFLTWRTAKALESAQWSQLTPAPRALQTRLHTTQLSHAISWERLLLDLHSGRLFGTWGLYLMDAAAIALLLLAGTGLWRQATARRHT